MTETAILQEAIERLAKFSDVKLGLGDSLEPLEQSAVETDGHRPAPVREN